MSLVSSIAIYFIIWWLVLFTVLPWGVKTQKELNDITPGTAESAPKNPRMLSKILATTLIAGAVFSVVYVVLTYRLITLDDIPFKF